MITAATTRLYALLKEAWPTGVQLLHPDDKVDFEDALGPPTSSGVIARYYSPQLMRAGTVSEFLARIDVCARRESTATTAAGDLLDLVGTNARTPNGTSDPRAVVLRESTYFRVAVSFTVITDAKRTPPTS